MPSHTTDTIRPPFPPRSRWWTRLRASLAGRRDARSAASPDDEGHLPFTRRLAAQSHYGHTEAGQWLHTRVEPGDRAISVATESIADARRAVGRIEGRLDEIATRLSSATATGDRIRLERERASLKAVKEAQQERSTAAARHLAELLVARRHVLDQARTAAAAWDARYHRLVANHQRAYLRRRKNAPKGLAPSVPPYLGWTARDLPLLTPVIDPEAEQILTVTLTPFLDLDHPHVSEEGLRTRS
jgi:hypothetical protein